MFEKSQALKKLLQRVQAIELKLKSQVDTALVGAYRSFFLGTGVDFVEVRPYVEGDDVRFIDWNITARTGKPYVRVYQEEREVKIYFLLDVSGSMFHYGKYEASVEVLSILVFSALKNGDRFGLICFSDKIEAFVPIQKGEEAFFRILLTALSFSPGRRGTALTVALDYVKRIVKRHIFLVLISDFIDEGYEKELLSLSQKHELLFIRPWNLKEGSLPLFGTIPIRDPESSSVIWIPPFLKPRIENIPRQIHYRLKKFKAQPRTDYLPLNTDLSVLKQLRAFYEKRVR